MPTPSPSRITDPTSFDVPPGPDAAYPGTRHNALEGLFHTFKHGERRRSGRKILTQDLEQIPAAALLALNLRHADYVELLCGSLEQLPAAFAKLDADGTDLCDDDDLPAETVSRSLPKIDREIVRYPDMFSRIYAAADSRAPRRA
jgi:hypothetical protein